MATSYYMTPEQIQAVKDDFVRTHDPEDIRYLKDLEQWSRDMEQAIANAGGDFMARYISDKTIAAQESALDELLKRLDAQKVKKPPRSSPRAKGFSSVLVVLSPNLLGGGA